MSKEALAKVVQRAISDGAFRRQLSTDPATALRGFDLSADESAAIRSGDAGRLTAMGVELRMSKAFTLSSDQATGDAARPVLSNDLGASFTGAMSSGSQTAGNSAIGNSALISGNAADTDAVLSAGNDSAREAANIPGGPDHAFGAQIGGESANFNAADLDANPGVGSSVQTSGDNAMSNVLIVDDSEVSGAATPGEATEGPTLQQ